MALYMVFNGGKGAFHAHGGRSWGRVGVGLLQQVEREGHVLYASLLLNDGFLDLSLLLLSDRYLLSSGTSSERNSRQTKDKNPHCIRLYGTLG